MKKTKDNILGDTKSGSGRKIKNWLWNVAKLFLAVLNVVGAITSIFGIVYSVIGQDSGLRVWAVVSMIFFIVLLFTVVVFIRSRKHDLMREAFKYSVGFHSILHKIRDEYGDLLEVICEATQYTSKQFEKYMIEHLGSIMTELADYLTIVTGSKVRACIKVFEDQEDPAKMPETYTLARSKSNVNEIRSEMRHKYRLEENTAFEKIYQIDEGYVDEREHYFIVDNMDDYVKNHEYKNSNPKYLKRYKTTIVMPIRCIEPENEEMEDENENDNACTYKIIGYLCVDSKKKNLFAGDNREIILEYLKGVSDIMYVYLSECIIYYGYLKELERENAENN